MADMMRKKLFLLSTGVLTSFSFYAAIFPLPAEANTQNFLGGVGQAAYALPFSDDTAGSIGLEGGDRQQRVSGTVGWEFLPHQRLKFTGEYLRQKIDYTFFTGISRQWVNQPAAGIDYQYSLNKTGRPDFLNYIDLSGYYSHAPSLTLDPVSGSYTDSSGNTVNYTNLRRIAGADAYGFTPALVMHPWTGSRVSLGLNYDDVRYDNIYTPQVTAQGVGETVKLSQDLGYNFQLNLLASDRKPFDNYQAGIVWVEPLHGADLSWGLMGSYTKGKTQLPNTSYAGVSLSYTAQKNQQEACQISNDAETSLPAWTSKPAVYMPQVLAIVDQKLVQTVTPAQPACNAPQFAGVIPDYDTVNNPGRSVDISTGSYFTGKNIVYSLQITPNDNNINVQINPSTGEITGNMEPVSINYSAVVTATNACGSAHSNAFLIYYD
jgi:hypothetical protein